MKNFAASTNTYHGFRLDDALAGIAATGIKQVELLAVKGWTEHVMPSMGSKQIVEIQSELHRYGLIPVALDGHADMMTEEGLDALYKGIDLASRMGCTWFVTELNQTCAKSDPSAYARMIQRTEDLARACAERNLRLAFETRGAIYNTGMKIFRFLQDADAKNTYINYDAANILFFAGENPYIDLTACKSRIGLVHLKDKAGADDEWNFPILGTGRLDVARILRLLPDDVLVSVDVEFTQAGPADVEEAHKAIRESCDYLRKIGYTL